TRCVDACPTGAISVDGVIDARRCLAWLVQDVGVFPREHRVSLGDRIYGCDDCQEVCPPGRRDVASADREVEVRVGPPPDAWVSVLELLDPAVGDDELLERFGRWYIPRRDPRHLRRNALIVLGNVGDPSDPSQRDVVARWCRDDDELLRA